LVAQAIPAHTLAAAASVEAAGGHRHRLGDGANQAERDGAGAGGHERRDAKRRQRQQLAHLAQHDPALEHGRDEQHLRRVRVARRGRPRERELVRCAAAARVDAARRAASRGRVGCERAQIPMFATRESSAFVIDILRAYLSKHFADRASMHGVFMDILGLGVMITGESGLGKSELGLELISRGNGLVADDSVDIYRINQTTLEGRCPDLLQNLLEVRGIGLLDIRAIFGETAVRRKMRLKLIVHLVRRETLERDYDRMPHEPLTQDILGVPVRKVVIQVVAGRNIAVLVEAAVRNTILQLRGINTYEEFAERQRQAMQT
jgi:Hpr(Ser) kinase/phosphatase